MFETGVRQLRMALSMLRGKAIDPRNVERLVGDALATLAMFGSPGDDALELVAGPMADPQSRRALQEQALRRTARRLAAVSPFYRVHFSSLGLDLKQLTLEQMSEIPVTTKRDLVERAAEFLADGSRPLIATRTTGTTGRPVEVWLSRYELDLWSAFGALGGVLRDELRPSDCIQINMSSRATATVQLTVSAYRLVGARTRVLGVVPVEDSIDSLLDGGDAAPTLLSAYPSYLAQLVREARRRALGPDDFHLRRIDCGGEVLSPSLVRAATETFGAEVGDVFGMTEVLPVRARVCEHGHLHHDVTMGFTEVVNLDSGSPCAPGEVGSLVITPYYPYRECMPVFRHDTRDLVRSLPEGELTCSLAAMPATSTVLGKAGHVLSIDGRIITPRELVEVLESLPGQPWPARFSATALADHLRIELSRDTAGELSPADLQRHIASRTGGVPVVCRVVDGDAALGLRRLRADLIEHTFTRQEA